MYIAPEKFASAAQKAAQEITTAKNEIAPALKRLGVVPKSVQQDVFESTGKVPPALKPGYSEGKKSVKLSLEPKAKEVEKNKGQELGLKETKAAKTERLEAEVAELKDKSHLKDTGFTLETEAQKQGRLHKENPELKVVEEATNALQKKLTFKPITLNNLSSNVKMALVEGKTDKLSKVEQQSLRIARATLEGKLDALKKIEAAMNPEVKFNWGEVNFGEFLGAKLKSHKSLSKIASSKTSNINQERNLLMANNISVEKGEIGSSARKTACGNFARGLESKYRKMKEELQSATGYAKDLSPAQQLEFDAVKKVARGRA